MQKVNWVAINGGFAVSVYYGFFENVEGARNIAMLLAWAMIAMSFFLLSDTVINELKKKGRAMPASVNVAFDVTIALVFAWFGAWVTAVFWLVHLVIQEAAWKQVKKRTHPSPD